MRHQMTQRDRWRPASAEADDASSATYHLVREQRSESADKAPRDANGLVRLLPSWQSCMRATPYRSSRPGDCGLPR